MDSITHVSSIELENNISQILSATNTTVPNHDEQGPNHMVSPRVEQYLEPVDRGLAAWRLLGSAFIVEAFFWGRILRHSSNCEATL